MIVVILLAILAVLLFGASAVLGAIGYALGFVAAVAALTTASILFEMSPFEVIEWAAIGLTAMVALFLVITTITRPYEIQALEKKAGRPKVRPLRK